MYKIDKKKWDLAVKTIVARRLTPGRPGWLVAQDAAELTLLYSIRAAGRGRCHRRAAELTHQEALRAWGDGCPWGYDAFVAAGGRMRFELGLEHQVRYVGDSWKKYAEEAPSPGIEPGST